VKPAVRKATTQDVPELARTLASAFSTDPVFTWMMPKRNQVERLRRFFAATLTHALKHEAVFTSERLDGVAVWLPPDKWKVPPGDILGLMPAMLRSFAERTPRALRTLSAIERHHPKHPPHWYLEALGTHRDAQRGGIGSAVIGLMLERCDREGVPAYLESSNEENIPFYRRHGFDVTEEIVLGKDSPPEWGMWRDPR
jgi:ribosomal protein S18 acetylase RimI-like enzyme